MNKNALLFIPFSADRFSCTEYLLQGKYEVCQQTSSPGLGRFSDLLPNRRSAILPETFYT